MRKSRIAQVGALVCAGAVAAVIAASPWAGASAGGAASATLHGKLTTSTPINSPAFVNYEIAVIEKGGTSAKNAYRAAYCLVKEYTKHGAKTVGDLEKNKPAALKIAKACGEAVAIVAKLEHAKTTSSSSSGTPAASPSSAPTKSSSVTG